MYPRFCMITGLLLMGSATLFAAGGPCKTTPVKVTISTTYTFGGTTASSMISPDGLGAYVDGVAGVSAIINTTCTGDLILDLRNSTRTVGFWFDNPVHTTSLTPSWIGTELWERAHVTVGNLMYLYSPSSAYSFTTNADFWFTLPGATKTQDFMWSLCFGNPSAQVPGTADNWPFLTSKVVVQHIPADPLTGAVETWTITPDNANMNPSGSPAATQVGSLLLAAEGKNKGGNAGQFSMPFQFTVTRSK